MKKTVCAYQGVPGAYSHIAAQEHFPTAEARGFPTFEDAVRALQRDEVDYALLPIENSTAGRVADIHHLLPESGLTVIGEHFLPVRHCLIAYRGTKKSNVRKVYSHREALAQCKEYIRSLGAEASPYGDTAGAVAFVSEEKRTDIAAVASMKAAEIYPHVVILQKNVQDKSDNVTRFLALTKKHRLQKQQKHVITSIAYTVRDTPAALFKSLGGFATTGTNIIKLESFVPMARHTDAHFYLEFEGDPRHAPFSIALEELRFYAKKLEILGTYPASSYRSRFGGAR